MNIHQPMLVLPITPPQENNDTIVVIVTTMRK
jgi:hypothetical protein